MNATSRHSGSPGTFDDLGKTSSLSANKLPGEKPRNPRLNFWINLSVSACFLVAIIGCVRAAGLLSKKYPITNECDNTGLFTWAEKEFQINLVAIRGLPFAQAKILDLVWDIGVAQGGRLLHGWILYHVTCNALTWSLERSSLPYPFLFNLFLWPDSILSLCSSLPFLPGKKRPRCLLAVVLAYAIAHVLFFGALWSAATGYQTPGTIAYAMPDGTWVAKDNDTLQVCWALDSQRLVDLLPADGVILGPKFRTHFQSFVELDSMFAKGRIWDSYPGLADDVSEDFDNIYSYARTKQTIKNFLQGPGHHYQAGAASADVVEWNTTRNGLADWFDDFNARGFPVLDYKSQSSQAFHQGWKPSVIKGWQFLGTRQNLSTHPEEMLWITNTLGEHSKPGRFGEDTGKGTRTQMTQFLASVFHLNTSIVTSGSDLVPYNSTLWYNGTRVRLEAPFLSFKICSWLSPALGECLCYKGKPLIEDFRQDSRKLCISGDGYIWGFSRSLVFIGLVLEVIWCYVCLMLYLLSTQRSELIRRGRPTRGVVRTILDLSEALRRDLGGYNSWQTERQLTEELRRRESVGYAVWDKGESEAYVGLVPFPEGTPRKRKLQVDNLGSQDGF